MLKSPAFKRDFFIVFVMELFALDYFNLILLVSVLQMYSLLALSTMTELRYGRPHDIYWGRRRRELRI